MPGYADALSLQDASFLQFSSREQSSLCKVLAPTEFGRQHPSLPSLCKNDARAGAATGAGGTERDEAPGPGTRHT